MIDVQEIAKLQEQTVAKWHQEKITNPYSGLLEIVCQQHSFNYRLWHEEDQARCPNADDKTIAQVKRNIDQLNQKRNDWIEKIDDGLTMLLEERGVIPHSRAPINTETPGSVMDRLSILALRIYHLQEQLQRQDVAPDHMDSVRHKIAVCQLQKNDLMVALQQLLNEIGSGDKRHRTYRQFKMYNDPKLNPYLNGQVTRRAG